MTSQTKTTHDNQPMSEKELEQLEERIDCIDDPHDRLHKYIFDGRTVMRLIAEIRRLKATAENQ